MAGSLDVRNRGRLNRGKRSQNIKNQRQQTAIRKSVRLDKLRHSQKQAGSGDRSTQRRPFPSPSISSPRSIQNSPDESKKTNLQKQQQPQSQASNLKQINLLSSSPADNFPGNEFSSDLLASKKPSVPSERLTRKRKRSQEAENPDLRAAAKPFRTQQRTLLATFADDIPRQKAANSNCKNNVGPVDHWIREGRWPNTYFKQDSQSKKDLQQYLCLEDYLMEQEIHMAHLLARKRSSASLDRKNSDLSTTAPSEQISAEAKSAEYRHPGYESLLATKGSYMDKSDLGITDVSKGYCRTLLDTEQRVPEDSIFRDDRFYDACRSVHSKNEARVVRDISPLICPSAEVLAIYNNTKPRLLIDSVNEGWINSISVTKTRPQPDYSVGFRRSAFSDDQLKRLEPFIGGLYYTSFFMATYYMHFPFLTCEVKSGAAVLDIADRQNAHSMTLAVRGVVELFRLVKREKELHREILAFSISHDHSTVRIYGHYALIEDGKTTFYRHPIKEFSFTSEEGKDKWTAYKFTKNVYDIWMPIHHKRICSAIDQIPPNVDFGVSAGDSFTPVASAADGSELATSQKMAASAPSSQDPVPFKKPKLPTKVALEKENERLRQERDQEREQSNQRAMELMELLKQQASSNERLKLEMDQEREQSKRAVDELKEQIKELMGMLKQRWS